MDSDLSLLEISNEDDSLLQNADVSHVHNNKTLFECSPLQFPRFKPPPHITRSSVRTPGSDKSSAAKSSSSILNSNNTDSANKENVKQQDSKLNMEPQKMKKKRTAGFNLRKSLAWNKAFFTEEGILDSSELSTLTGNFDNSSAEMLPAIEEEDEERESSSNNSTFRQTKQLSGTSTPTRCSPARNNVASASAAKRKVVSPYELNKSGAKRSVKRSLTVNGPNPPVKESKLSKIPVRKPQPVVHSTTPVEGLSQPRRNQTALTVNSTNTSVKRSKTSKIPVRRPQPFVHSTSVEGTNQSKKNITALPVNVLKKNALKGSSNNVKDTRSGTSGLSLTAKSTVLQARRNQVQSASEKPTSSGLRNLPVQKTNDRSNFKVNPDPILSASGHPLNGQKSENIQTAPPQIAKPSGLRMPSPSLRFFGQSKPPPATSLLPRSTQPCNLPKNSHLSDFGQQSLEHTKTSKSEQISPVVKELESDRKNSLIRVASFENLENYVDIEHTKECVVSDFGQQSLEHSKPCKSEQISPVVKEFERAGKNSLIRVESFENLENYGDIEQAKESAVSDYVFQENSKTPETNNSCSDASELHTRAGVCKPEMDKSQPSSTVIQSSDNAVNRCQSSDKIMTVCDLETLNCTFQLNMENEEALRAYGMVHHEDAVTEYSIEVTNTHQSSAYLTKREVENFNCSPQYEASMQLEEDINTEDIFEHGDAQDAANERTSAQIVEDLPLDEKIHLEDAMTQCSIDLSEREMKNSSCMSQHEDAMQVQGDLKTEAMIEHKDAELRTSERNEEDLRVDDTILYENAVTQCSTYMINNHQSSGDLLESELRNSSFTPQDEVCMQVEEDMKTEDMIEHGDAENEHGDSLLRNSVQNEAELENSNYIFKHEVSKKIEGGLKCEDAIKYRNAVLRTSLQIEDLKENSIPHDGAVTQCSTYMINNHQSSGGLMESELRNSSFTPQDEVCMQVEEEMKTEDMIEHGDAKNEQGDSLLRYSLQIEAEVENSNCIFEHEASKQVEGGLKFEDAIKYMNAVLRTSVQIEEDLKENSIPHDEAVTQCSTYMINNHQSSGDLMESELRNSSFTPQDEVCMQVEEDMKTEDMIEHGDAENEHGDSLLRNSVQIEGELENPNCIFEHEASKQVEGGLKCEDTMKFKDAVLRTSVQIEEDLKENSIPHDEAVIQCSKEAEDLTKSKLESSNCTFQPFDFTQAEGGDSRTYNMVEHENIESEHLDIHCQQDSQVMLTEEPPNFCQLGTSNFSSDWLNGTHKVSSESLNYGKSTTSCLIEADNAARDENCSQNASGLQFEEIESVEDLSKLNSMFAAAARPEVIGLHPQDKQDLGEKPNEVVEIGDIMKTTLVENARIESLYDSLVVDTIDLPAVANDDALMFLDGENRTGKLDNGHDVNRYYSQVEDSRSASIEIDSSVENTDMKSRHDDELNIQATSSISSLDEVGCLAKESGVISTQTPLSGSYISDTDTDTDALQSHILVEEAQTNISQNNGNLYCEILSETGTRFDVAETHEKTDDKKQKALEIKLPLNAPPFSDEWLAALETAGEEILTMKSGTVQHSPPEKPVHEPNPWSPVRRKNNLGIGPFDCTKFSNPNAQQPSDSN
ncbi:hypothetical protein ACFE04_007502 [Oxalis oulophora]